MPFKLLGRPLKSSGEMVEVDETTLNYTPQKRDRASGNARPLGDIREANYREIWKMVGLDPHLSNQFIDILQEWEAVLQDVEGAKELVSTSEFGGPEL